MNYLKYLWKAKGRHGTHSPFIYDLVESALHPKITSIDLVHTNVGGHSLKKVNTIWRIANHIKVEHGYIDQNAIVAYPFLGQFDGFSELTFQLLNSRSRNCIIITPQEVEEFVSKLSDPFETEVAILVIHFNNKKSQNMEDFFRLARFNLSVFAWDFSILMYNKDVKRKQHFILR